MTACLQQSINCTATTASPTDVDSELITSSSSSSSFGLLMLELPEWAWYLIVVVSSSTLLVAIAVFVVAACRSVVGVVSNRMDGSSWFLHREASFRGFYVVI